MKILNKLIDIIPHIPHIKKGKYNGFSFVLIGGSSYKSIYFDKVNVKKDDMFYRKFNYEVEYPNINFQTRLSKISTTFSFDRPTDLLNNNLYANDINKYIYIASLQDLTIKKYSQFIYNLLNYHKIKPPYIFITFSEGGFDVLCFSKYYSKLIKQIYFVDTPLLEKYFYEFEEFRGGKNDPNQGLGFYKRLTDKKFSWNHKKYDKINKDELEKIDLYNFEIKSYNIIMKIKIKDFSNKIPMVIFWSPYFDSHIKCKEKINIIKRFNKKLNKNIKTMFMDGPHQMERVLPITLSNYIIKNNTEE